MRRPQTCPSRRRRPRRIRQVSPRSRLGAGAFELPGGVVTSSIPLGWWFSSARVARVSIAIRGVPPALASATEGVFAIQESAALAALAPGPRSSKLGRGVVEPLDCVAQRPAPRGCGCASRSSSKSAGLAAPAPGSFNVVVSSMPLGSWLSCSRRADAHGIGSVSPSLPLCEGVVVVPSVLLSLRRRSGLEIPHWVAASSKPLDYVAQRPAPCGCGCA
jgi:hypothetical protein